MVCAKNEIPYGFVDELNFNGFRIFTTQEKIIIIVAAMHLALILGIAPMMMVGIVQCMMIVIQWKKELNSQLTICSKTSVTSA